MSWFKRVLKAAGPCSQGFHNDKVLEDNGNSVLVQCRYCGRKVRAVA